MTNMPSVTSLIIDKNGPVYVDKAIMEVESQNGSWQSLVTPPSGLHLARHHFLQMRAFVVVEGGGEVGVIPSSSYRKNFSTNTCHQCKSHPNGALWTMRLVNSHITATKQSPEVNDQFSGEFTIRKLRVETLATRALISSWRFYQSCLILELEVIFLMVRSIFQVNGGA